MPQVTKWVARLLTLFCIIFSANGMIEHISSNVGYEVRSIHQFKYAPKGTLSMTAKALFRNNNNEKDREEQAEKEKEKEGSHSSSGKKSSGKTIGTSSGASLIGSSKNSKNKNKQVSQQQRRLLEDEEEEGGDTASVNDIDDPATIPALDDDDMNGGKDVLYLYHCSDSELNKLSDYSEMDDLCSDIENSYSDTSDTTDTSDIDSSDGSGTTSVFDCSWSDRLSVTSPQLSYSFESRSAKWMTLIGINCNEDNSFSASFSVEAMNPNGEYLSLSEVPYKPLYLYLAGVWAFVSALWFMHWWRYSIFNVSIHQLLTFCPIFMSSSCVVWHFYWNYCSVYGQASDSYTLFAYFASALVDAWIALCLMYIAEGWGILRGSFDSYKRVAEIWGITILVFVSDILTNYFTSLLILLVISYVLTLRRVLNGYTHIMRLLNSQHEILASVDPNTAHYDSYHPLNVKLSIYKAFQKCVILFIGCEVIYYWGSSFLIETPWVNTILSNSIIFALTLYVGWEFRMRPFRPNFHLYAIIPDGNEQDGNSNENDNDMSEDMITQEWSPGMTVPLFPKDYNTWLSSNNSEIVVIENEVDIDNDNKTIKHYSIAAPIICYSKLNKIGGFKDDRDRIRRMQEESNHYQRPTINMANEDVMGTMTSRNDTISINMSYNSTNNTTSVSNSNGNLNEDGGRINYEGSGILDNHSDSE